MSVSMLPGWRLAAGDNSQPQPATAPAPAQAAPGASPLQPAYVQAPFASPTYANDRYATDPRYAVQQILRGFAPQAARSTNALDNQLAAMGVSGGGAVDAQRALQGELASNLAPTLGQAYTQYAGNSLAQTLQNAAAANSMTGMNAGNVLQANEFNAGSYNSMGALLAQLLEEEYGLKAGSLTGLISQGLSGQTAINQGAEGTAGGLAQQQAGNFPIYRAPDFSGLASSLGTALAPKVPPPAPVAPSSFNF